MSQRIQIQVTNKIATCLTEIPVVCGNSDYEVEFLFDEEWGAYEVKTARFKIRDTYMDVVFSGNICEMPIIRDAKFVLVGAFAGELSTTTPALVNCRPSILEGDEIPAPPSEDVYNQIMELLNQYIEQGGSGESGVSPTVNIIPIENGHRVIITDVNGEHTFDVMNGKDGANGNDGKNGIDGEDGYTPVRGTDYWTEDDIAVMKSYIDAQISPLSEEINGVEEELQMLNEGGVE